MDAGISEAFFYTVSAIAKASGKTPLPKELIQVEVGTWKLAVNASMVPVAIGEEELSPLTCRVESTKYLVIGYFDPTGGMIGGMPEDVFISEMKAIAGDEA